MKNWKTTAGGIGTILTAAGGLAHDISIGDYSRVPLYVTALLGGIGLLFAKDHNVTGGTTQQ